MEKEEKLGLVHTEEIELDKALGEAREKSREFLKLMSYYKCAMMEIETKLNVLKEEFALSYDRNPINSISSRLKAPQAIFEKLKRRDQPQNVAAAEMCVNDIAGVRVTCLFVEDVYMLADAILSQDDIILVNKKDYIANPKENGYRSLHLMFQFLYFYRMKKGTLKLKFNLEPSLWTFGQAWSISFDTKKIMSSPVKWLKNY